MGVVSDLTEYYGLSDPDVDFQTPSEQLGERSFVQRIIDSLETMGTEDDELIQSERRRARRDVESQANRNMDRVNEELEKRGLSNSGVAVDAAQDVGRKANQTLVDALANIQQTRAQRQGQALQSALNLSGQQNQIAQADAQTMNRETQSQRKAERSGTDKLVRGISALLQTGSGESAAGNLSGYAQEGIDYVFGTDYTADNPGFGDTSTTTETTASTDAIETSLGHDQRNDYDGDLNYSTRDAAGEYELGMNNSGGISGGASFTF